MDDERDPDLGVYAEGVWMAYCYGHAGRPFPSEIDCLRFAAAHNATRRVSDTAVYVKFVPWGTTPT